MGAVRIMVRALVVVWLLLGAWGCVSSSEEPSTTGEEQTLQLPGGVELVLLRIPAGSFVMGSPEGERERFTDEVAHRVTLTRPFLLGRTEVTQAQWRAVMGALPSEPCRPCVEDPDHPVTCVDFTEVAGPGGFMERLGRHLEATGQATGAAVRLPTEAEWEYAARAGTTTRYHFGDALGCGDGCEWCAELDRHMVWCGNDRDCTEPVASRQPNPWGLYDMHGNAWEWVADRLGRYGPEPVTDPVGPERGSHHIIRGGSWVNQACACRSAARNADAVTHRGDVLGFRVAMTAR